MSTVRVYKSTDPGAPPHPSNVRGSMAALLRACLVTGYGSGDDYKAPAGWEEPFTEESNRAVFRALEGQRLFYQVDDNYSPADTTVLRCYDSMSSPSVGIGYRMSGRFGKRYSDTDIYSTEWFVIADELTCYCFLRSRYGIIPHGLGEYYSYVADDPQKSFLALHSSTVGLPGSASGQYAAMTHGGSMVQATLGEPVQVGTSLAGTYQANYLRALSNMIGPGGATAVASTINGTDYFAACPTGQGISYPVFPAQFSCCDPSEKLFRGQLRGIYYPGAYKPKIHKEAFVYDGRDFLSLDYGLYSSTSTQGQLWIDISGSWEESP